MVSIVSGLVADPIIPLHSSRIVALKRPCGPWRARRALPGSSIATAFTNLTPASDAARHGITATGDGQLALVGDDAAPTGAEQQRAVDAARPCARAPRLWRPSSSSRGDGGTVLAVAQRRLQQDDVDTMDRHDAVGVTDGNDDAMEPNPAFRRTMHPHYIVLIQNELLLLL